MQKGDILIGLSGSIGKLCVYDRDEVALQNQRTGLFVFNTEVSRSYIRYFLETISTELQREAKGVAVQNISSKQIEATPLPLAPLPTQHQIVAEIEKQFTRLDAAVAALRRARANLARYKAAVLKAAVEGRLVAQDAADEPASELLARILAERRARWEAAHPGKKYIEPRRPDVDDLPELPEGWVWASFEQLLFSAQNGFGKRNSSIGEPTIVLRLADIAQGGISLENVRRIKMSNEEIEKYQLHEGDLLCLRVNGSPKLVGRMIYIRKFDEDIAFCDHFIRFQPVDIEIAPFIALYFGSEIIRKFVELNMVSSAGQNTVSQRILFDILIPLPPMTEQRLIISELDRRLSIIQTTEQALDANLARAERLRQAVLGKAFRGELV